MMRVRPTMPECRICARHQEPHHVQVSKSSKGTTIMATQKKTSLGRKLPSAKAKVARKPGAKRVTKKAAQKVAAKVPPAKVNGLPKPSTKPWGQAGKALDGVKIL